MKNKITFKFQIDHILDLITNSSSELFVIENKCAKETIAELINEALKNIITVKVSEIEERFKKDGQSDCTWEIDNALELFPETDREMLKEKYFTTPKYYGISFDRDWIYRLNNEGRKDLRSILTGIGFEMVDSDY